jgi:hypothetical protein
MLWTRFGGPVAVLSGDDGKTDICGALELSNGEIVSWASPRIMKYPDRDVILAPGSSVSVTPYWVKGDCRILIWNRKGKIKTVLNEINEGVIDVIELSNGRILSWHEDNSLCLWQTNGKAIAVMRAHKNEIQRAAELHSGDIISWSDNVHIWDRNGKAKRVVRIIDFLKESYEFASIFQKEDLRYGRFVGLAEDNTGILCYYNNKPAKNIFLNWNGEIKCEAQRLSADGTMSVEQANDQLCILSIYHGAQRINLDELEKIIVEGKA